MTMLNIKPAEFAAIFCIASAIIGFYLGRLVYKR